MTFSKDQIWKWKTTDKLWTVLKPQARRLRTEATPAEDRLWAELRGRRLQGARFRRDHTISRFIVDFYCGKARLVIEVDGPIHEDQREEDAQRQAILESQGLCVLRFTNAMVEQEMAAVLSEIGRALAARTRVK
ncbi:MAG: endonuclease domain-containing protein [SAR324 cluster bacterium]